MRTDAREILAAQIKFLEIDLADAKRRFEQANDELSRADNANKKVAGTISTGQYGQIRLAQRLAQSQHERAQMLVDLYRKALPDQEASDEKKQPSAEPQFKDVWMTDFATARERALKLHRPLVACFWSRSAESRRAMKAVVLSNPDVLRMLAKHFVAVIVDIEVDKKTLALFEFGEVDKEVKQYNEDFVPTVLVLSLLGDTRRVLVRADELKTAATLLDLLKKLVPETRTDGPAEFPAADDPARQPSEEKPGAP